MQIATIVAGSFAMVGIPLVAALVAAKRLREKRHRKVSSSSRADDTAIALFSGTQRTRRRGRRSRRSTGKPRASVDLFANTRSDESPKAPPEA